MALSRNRAVELLKKKSADVRVVEMMCAYTDLRVNNQRVTNESAECRQNNESSKYGGRIHKGIHRALRFGEVRVG